MAVNSEPEPQWPDHKVRRTVARVILYTGMAAALGWSIFQVHEIASGSPFRPDPKSPVFIGGRGETVSADLLQTKQDWMNALMSFNHAQVQGVAYRSNTGTRLPISDRQGYDYSLATPFDNAYCQPGYGTLGGNGQVYFTQDVPLATSQAHLDSFFQEAGYRRTARSQSNGELHLTYTRPVQERGNGQLYSSSIDAPLNSDKRGNVSSVATAWQIQATVSERLVILTLPREPCYPQREVPKDRNYTVADVRHVLDFYRWLPGYPAHSFDQVTEPRTVE